LHLVVENGLDIYYYLNDVVADSNCAGTVGEDSICGTKTLVNSSKDVMFNMYCEVTAREVKGFQQCEKVARTLEYNKY
jgi:hypothetical protein